MDKIWWALRHWRNCERIRHNLFCYLVMETWSPRPKGFLVWFFSLLFFYLSSFFPTQAVDFSAACTFCTCTQLPMGRAACQCQMCISTHWRIHNNQVTEPTSVTAGTPAFKQQLGPKVTLRSHHSGLSFGTLVSAAKQQVWFADKQEYITNYACINFYVL